MCSECAESQVAAERKPAGHTEGAKVGKEKKQKPADSKTQSVNKKQKIAQRVQRDGWAPGSWRK